MSLIIKDLIEQVNQVEEGKGYWFVRTDSGLHYETYFKNGFIGIGWNYITIEDLIKKSETDIKTKIAKRNNLDLEITKSKSKVTSVYTKLKRFQELKKGDLVIIPSYGSSRYGFGIIDDNRMYSDLERSHECEYYKRRKVRWLTEKHISNLDPIFHLVKVSRHAISDISRYANYIDNVTNSLYVKQDFGHYVLDITTNNDISVNDLIDLVQTIKSLSIEINKYFEFEESIDETFIRLNLQSPGKVEFKQKAKATIITLAMVLSLVSCGSDSNTSRMSEEEKNELNGFIELNREKLQQIDSTFDKLKVDKERINRLY